MEKSKVYFSDFRTPAYGDGIPTKLKKLIKAAGIGSIDMDGRFVAIKMHFGELGNVSFLRPNFAKVVVDVVKELGGKPFLTDCNTMYPGFRKNALEHLECAWENGFTPLSAGCPVIIADGLKGTDDIAVPVEGGEYTKEALIGRAVMDADVFISLTHFKGHEMTGFGGTIKNIGMGCGSRAGKKDQHSAGKATIYEDKCRGCRRCQKECANGGLVYDAQARKMRVDESHCVGCGRCLGAGLVECYGILGREPPDVRKDGRIVLGMAVAIGGDVHDEGDVKVIASAEDGFGVFGHLCVEDGNGLVLDEVDRVEVAGAQTASAAHAVAFIHAHLPGGLVKH